MTISKLKVPGPGSWALDPRSWGSGSWDSRFPVSGPRFWGPEYQDLGPRVLILDYAVGLRILFLNVCSFKDTLNHFDKVQIKTFY